MVVELPAPLVAQLSAPIQVPRPFVVERSRTPAVENLSWSILVTPALVEVPAPATAELKSGAPRIYTCEKEAERLGLSSGFRISHLNREFALCSSYPDKFVVPVEVHDESLKRIAQFRSRERIPVITWRRQNSLLIRCAQPLPGFFSRRCVEDEYFFKVIAESTKGTTKVQQFHGKKTILLLDCRPRVNAVGNIASGGGWEYAGNYPDIEVCFGNIENIHGVRESFTNLRDLFTIHLLSEATNVDTVSTLGEEGTKRYSGILWKLREGKGTASWFSVCQPIMESAVKVADWISSEGSVVVHCSDGWDRTSQVTSLAQLILDGYYRTIEGFAVLIEKEWVSFGHKFATRCGRGRDGDKDDKQRSPIFLQFLDCVHQLMIQFPSAFQFKPCLLVTIAEEVNSCRFGTFLFDNEKERQEANVKTATKSLWSFVLDDAKSYENEQYVDVAAPLSVKTDMNSFVLWIDYYQRWDPSVQAFASELEEKPRTEDQRTILLKLFDRIGDKFPDLMNPSRRFIRKDSMIRKSTSLFVAEKEGIIFMFNDLLIWTSSSLVYKGHLYLADLNQIERRFDSNKWWVDVSIKENDEDEWVSVDREAEDEWVNLLPEEVGGEITSLPLSIAFICEATRENWIQSLSSLVA